MRVAAFFLAEYASVTDGLINVIGGSASVVRASGFPIPVGMTAVAVLELENNEVGIDHPVRLVLETEAGAPAGGAQGSIRVDPKPGSPRLPGGVSLSAFAVDLRLLALSTPGAYRVVLFVGDRELSNAGFVVERLPDGGGGTLSETSGNVPSIDP